MRMVDEPFTTLATRTEAAPLGAMLASARQWLLPSMSRPTA
jgi:hypothetical protein